MKCRPNEVQTTSRPNFAHIYIIYECTLISLHLATSRKRIGIPTRAGAQARPGRSAWWLHGGYIPRLAHRRDLEGVHAFSEAHHALLQRWLHGGYTVVTRWLHGGYTAVTRRLHGGYMPSERRSMHTLLVCGQLDGVDGDSVRSEPGPAFTHHPQRVRLLRMALQMWFQMWF